MKNIGSIVFSGVVVAMACRGTLADTTVRCWGFNTVGQCNVPANLGTVTQVAGGYQHTIAIKLDGSVACWGNNASGQCTVPADLGTVTQVAGGYYHTIALKADGTVVCWGSNGALQCTVPADLGTITQVAGGYAHTIALKADGTVACWGRQNEGQCNVPASLVNVGHIAGGNNNSLALRLDGTLALWGSNTYGQRNIPVGIGAVAQIAGGDHTIALVNSDCDGNGIEDATELDEHDCNNNGIVDACDALAGTIEDCNENGEGDSCEKQLQIDLESGHLGPIGFGQPQTWTIADAVLAAAPVTLSIRGKGDFSGALEYVRIRVGSEFDENALAGTSDCGVPVWKTLTLTPTEVNDSIGADGALRIELEPSAAVDPNLCPTGTWVELKISYVGAAPSDCNANGLLDSCEIASGQAADTNKNGVIDTCESLLLACPTDLDHSGETDGGDLGILLGAWGSIGQSAIDLNGDGTVDGGDLGLLLGGWGPCVN